MPKIVIPARPETDTEFLELIAKILFVMGFRWQTVEDRWPKIRNAFENFNVEKVAAMETRDVIDRDGVIRNRWKIDRIIQNAEMCLEIIEEYGSMKEWSQQIVKEYEESPLLNPSLEEECRARFIGIGKVTSRWLAHTITKENPEREVVER